MKLLFALRQAVFDIETVFTARTSSLLKFLLPYTPMLTKSEKNRKKFKILNFEKMKKWSGDIVKTHHDQIWRNQH